MTSPAEVPNRLPPLNLMHERWMALTIEERMAAVLVAMNDELHEQGLLPPDMHLEYGSPT